jgi:WD40 repeat protein/DNA replication protein DnaC
LLDEYILGRKDNRRLKLIRDAFADKTEIPLVPTVQLLFPEKELNPALDDFRKFRDRLKKAAKQANISLELVVKNPKAELEERMVIVMGELSPKDKLHKKLSPLAEDMERQHRDYPVNRYQPQRVTLPLRTIIYDKELDNFFTDNLPLWQVLSDDAKYLIKNLSIKLEPFTKIFPKEPEAITMGFEMLGINGQDGGSFYQVIERCKELEIPDELPRLAFLILSLLASQDIRRWWRQAGIEGAEDLMFTINLDNELLSSNLFSPIFNKYLETNAEGRLLFEVNEAVSVDKIDRIKGLCHIYHLKVALDDSAQMQNTLRQGLSDYVSLVKVSFKTSQELLYSIPKASPLTTIDELAKYRQRDKPFVIEGIENEEWIDFLRNNWHKEHGELYIQGYAVRCSKRFTKFLQPPEESGIKGAYLISYKPDQPTIPIEPLRPSAKRRREELERQIYEKGRFPKKLFPEDKYPEERWIPATIKTDAGNKDAIKFLEQWVSDKHNQPFCAILGDLGVGKTFLCRMFTRDLFTKIKEKGDLPLPLYLDLKHLSLPAEAQMPPLEGMIENILQMQGISVDGKEVVDLVHAGEVVLLIDSIDEKTVGFDSERALHFWSQIRRGVTTKKEQTGESQRPEFSGKVLLACRTHYFRDMEDADAQLTEARRAGFRSEDFKMGFLNRFTEPQILRYLRYSLKDKADELWNTLKGIYNIPELAKTPFLLSLIDEHISEIIKEKKTGTEVTSAWLYELTIKEWIKRDSVSRKEFLPAEIKPKLMENLALRLWKEETQVVHIDNIDEWMRKYVIPEEFPTTPWDEQLKKDLRTTTFISWTEDEDKVGRGIFSFAHRSFQEFFIARRIARSLSQNDTSPLNIPKISSEIAEFVLGLLMSDKYNIQQAKETIEDRLGTSYSPQISENALILMLKWKSLYPDSYPLPYRLSLSGARLDGFVFDSLKLQSSSFDKASLESAEFRGCDISHTGFAGANMKEARFVDVTANHTRFNQAICSGSVWKNVTSDTCSFQDADLTSASFSDSRLAEADFTSANLRFATFIDTDLSGANFDLSILQHTGLLRCNLKEISCSPDQFKDSVLIMPEGDFPLPASHQINDLLPRVLTGHEGSVYSVAISKEAGMIVSGSSDKTIKLWDIKTGRLINTLKGHTGWVYSVAISKEAGMIASGSGDETIKLWDIRTGRLINTLKGHTGSVSSVAISKEAGIIASGSSDETIKLWDINTGRLINTLKGHRGSVLSVAISKDAGMIVSGSLDDTIKLWDINTFRLINTLKGHEDDVTSVAISKEAGMIVSGSRDNTIKLWDIKTFRLINTLKGHEGIVESVAISKEAGMIVSGSLDDTIKLWDIKTFRLINTLKGHEGIVESVAISKEAGMIVSGSSDNTIKLWDINTGRLINTLKGHENDVYSVAISKEAGLIVSSSYDNTVKLWDINTGRLINTLKGHEDSVFSVAISKEVGMIVSGSSDNTIKLWDIKTFRLINTLQGHRGSVLSVAISKDAGMIVSGSLDDTIKLWDIKTFRLINTLKGHEGIVESVAISKEAGMIVSGSSDNTIKLWDIKTGRLINTLKGHESSVYSIAISKEAEIIASGSWDNTIKLWDIKTGELINTLKGHESYVNSVAISKDLGMIVSGSWDNTIKLWDIKTGELINTLKGHEGSVRSVAISKEAGIIASGSYDETIKLWDIKGLKEKLTIHLLPEDEWVVISGDRIISGNAQRYAGLGINLTNFPATVAL